MCAPLPLVLALPPPPPPPTRVRSGSNAAHDSEKLEGFLEEAFTAGRVADGVIAQDGVQAAALWRLREEAAPAMTAHGTVYSYDISLPLERMYDAVTETKEKLAEAGFEMYDPSEGGKPGSEYGENVALVAAYGHLGDCNIHLNVVVPSTSLSGCEVRRFHLHAPGFRCLRKRTRLLVARPGAHRTLYRLHPLPPSRLGRSAPRTR